MAVDRVVIEGLKPLIVLPGGKDLKGADADMALRHAGQDGAGQGAFADDLFAGADRGKRAGGGNAKRVHRLGDDVFAQDRTQPRTAIPPA